MSNLLFQGFVVGLVLSALVIFFLIPILRKTIFQAAICRTMSTAVQDAIQHQVEWEEPVVQTLIFSRIVVDLIPQFSLWKVLSNTEVRVFSGPKLKVDFEARRKAALVQVKCSREHIQEFEKFKLNYTDFVQITPGTKIGDDIAKQAQIGISICITLYYLTTIQGVLTFLGALLNGTATHVVKRVECFVSKVAKRAVPAYVHDDALYELRPVAH